MHRIFYNSHGTEYSAGIFKQFMGVRNRVGIGLSYRLRSQAELVPRNRFLGSLIRALMYVSYKTYSNLSHFDFLHLYFVIFSCWHLAMAVF
jgi:hypothetical protein